MATWICQPSRNQGEDDWMRKKAMMITTPMMTKMKVRKLFTAFIADKQGPREKILVICLDLSLQKLNPFVACIIMMVIRVITIKLNFLLDCIESYCMYCIILNFYAIHSIMSVC